MGFWNIIPILGNHVEDQLRDPAAAPAAPDEHEAFDHELRDKPQPYFPADRSETGEKQP